MFANGLYKDEYGIRIGYHGDTEVSEEWNDYLNKLKVSIYSRMGILN